MFGDNVVNCGSKKLVSRKQFDEDFPILKLVYGELRCPCRHPNKSLGNFKHLHSSVFPISTECIILASLLKRKLLKNSLVSDVSRIL